MIKKILYGLLGLFAILLVAFYLFLYQADIPVEDLKDKYAYGASEFIDFNGLNVHFRSEGSGPTVLLLHGTGSSLHTWEPWVELLRDSFQVITMDLPGFGLTGPHPEGTYTTPAYNETISSLMDYLGIRKFSIGGNSLGGYISWNYAMDNPSRIESLVLVDPAGFPTPPVALFKLVSNPILGPLLSKVSVRSLVEKNLKEVYTNDELVSEELIDRYYNMSLRAGNRQALRDRVNRREESRVARLSEIKCPTLIQWGSDDLWIPVDHAQKYCDAIEDCQIKIYEAGHVPMEELPVQTGKDALSFLSQSLLADNN
jgi:pimeloyl-ACP methyl ester carboxylesterase